MDDLEASANAVLGHPMLITSWLGIRSDDFEPARTNFLNFVGVLSPVDLSDRTYSYSYS